MTQSAVLPYHRKDDIDAFHQAVGSLIDGSRGLAQAASRATHVLQKATKKSAKKSVKRCK